MWLQRIFELPASMSSFLFMPMWEMHMERILCCIGDKRCEIVGHMLRINCYAMIAIFVYTLEASNRTLPVYRECGPNVKCIRLIKGVLYMIKLCT